MKNILFYLLLLFLIAYACAPSPYDKEALALNNKGISLSYIHPDSALIYFDKAIAVDTSFHLAIQNKTNLLIKEKRYQEALESLDFFMTKISNPQTWIMKGIILEKLHKENEAKEAYLVGLHQQEKLLENAPESHKGTYEVNIGFTYFLLGDTSRTKQLISSNPKAAEKIPLSDSILRYLDDKEKITAIFLNSSP